MANKSDQVVENEENPSEVVEPEENHDGLEESQEETSEAEENPEEENQQESEEVQISLGESEPEPEEEKGAEWVRNLRKEYRQAVQEARQAKKELEAIRAQSAAPAVPVLGPKPKLSDPDIDYDEEKLDSALDRWHSKKREVDAQKESQEAEARKTQEQWQATVQNYEAAKKAIKVADFEDAEENVKTVFSDTQQALILRSIPDSVKAAQFIYAVGKNVAQAKKLASIQDPVLFVAEIGELRGKVNVQPKKTAPPPEKRIKSGVGGASAVNNDLDRLIEKARETGDYDKVMELKRLQKAKK